MACRASTLAEPRQRRTLSAGWGSRGLGSAQRLAGARRRLPRHPRHPWYRGHLTLLGRPPIRHRVGPNPPDVVGTHSLVGLHSSASWPGGTGGPTPSPTDLIFPIEPSDPTTTDPLAHRPRRARGVEGGPHRLSACRCRHAAAGPNGLDAQPGPDGHSEFPGQGSTDRLAGGRATFPALLVDGEPAQNGGNWQWAAGTGPDAAPYFRIFNPTSQSEKFDPDGTYIRRWVPELAALDDRAIHATLQAGSTRAGGRRHHARRHLPCTDRRPQGRPGTHPRRLQAGPRIAPAQEL